METRKQHFPLSLVLIIAGALLFTACDNITNTDTDNTGEVDPTAAEIPAPVIIAMFGITGDIMDAIDVDQDGNEQTNPPAGISVTNVKQTTGTWAEAKVTFTNYRPANPPAEYPNLTIGTSGGQTITVSKTTNEANNAETVKYTGSLTISGYAFPSFTYNNVTTTIDTTAGETAFFPIASTGTVTAGTAVYQVSQILTAMLHSFSFSMINQLLFLPSLQDFITNAQNPSDPPGLTITWTDEPTGKIKMTFVASETGEGITGEFDVTITGATETQPPGKIAFNGAMNINETSETPIRYLRLENVAYTWNNPSRSGPPDNPPDSATGKVTIGTTEYSANYLIQLFTLLAAPGGQP